MTRPALNSLILSLALALPLAVAPSSGFAQTAEWFTDAAESSDGKYLFVSLSNRPLEVEFKDEGLTGEERDQIEFFRLHYPVSGMYLNDGSNTPLWKFEKPWPGEPVIFPDGDHIVFQGGWVTKTGGSEVAEFTRRGVPLRSYTSADFITSLPLKQLLNGGNTPTCAKTSFDPQALTYTITTNQGEEYIFNVKNGDLIDSHSPFPLYFSIAGGTLVALIAAPIVIRSRRKRSDFQPRRGTL
jgi:hypothetical protein